jgi:hypothetical protein
MINLVIRLIQIIFIITKTMLKINVKIPERRLIGISIRINLTSKFNNNLSCNKFNWILMVNNIPPKNCSNSSIEKR